MTIRASNTNRHNSTLVILTLVTTVLLSGLTTNVPTAVFADSKLLGQSTKQTSNCDIVGVDSPVSDHVIREQQTMSIVAYQEQVELLLQI